MKKILLMLKNKNIANLLYPLIGVGLFVLVWYIASKVVGIEMILPSPQQSVKSLINLFGKQDFWLAVGNTLGRSLYAFIISVLFAIVLAIIGYVLPIFAKIISPLVVLLRSVPTMSIILLALIWLDASSAPVLITFLILFPQLYSSFLSSLNGINVELIDMSKAYKVPLYKRIIGLYVPEVLPTSLDAMKSNVSLGVKVTIAGEVLAQTFASMGVNMQISKMYLDTAELLGWTIVAVLLSYALEGVFTLIKFSVVRGRR